MKIKDNLSQINKIIKNKRSFINTLNFYKTNIRKIREKIIQLNLSKTGYTVKYKNTTL